MPPELVFDRGLGDLFVIRTAGHVIDNAVLGSLEFGVAELNIPLLMVLGTRYLPGFYKSNRPFAQSIRAQLAINFIASLLVLGTGLMYFGRDGKMATYAALVVVAALCQWVLIRGWSRV